MASSVYHINTPKTKNSCREILSLSNGERGAKMALEEIKRKWKTTTRKSHSTDAQSEMIVFTL